MRRGQAWAGERGAVKAIALPVLLMIILAGYAGHQAPTVRQDHDSGSFQISVEVVLVVLHASVSDRRGGFVSDLCERDFVVYEDGVPQPIRLLRNEDVPVTVGLVIDHSTTMLTKLEEVAAAARTFVQSRNREDEMFVVNFNENVSLGLPGTMHFSSNTDELEKAIMAAPADGQTALYDAIAKGLEELQTGSRDKKVLIVVSDGGDNVSALNLAQVMTLAERSSAIIYTVGIFDQDNPDRNPRALRRLAQATGGEAFLPEKLGEVVTICERIARDIRHQYTIGYVPANLTRDDAYRAIRVVARAKNHGSLSVRTRTGYRASSGTRPDEKGAR